jgi:hypothetical protein
MNATHPHPLHVDSLRAGRAADSLSLTELEFELLVATLTAFHGYVAQRGRRVAA